MVDELQQNRQFAMAEVRPLIGAHEARVNVTWQGQNADLPDPVSWDASDGDVKQWVTEALRGGIPGIRADAQVNLQDFVVDRFAANDAVPYNRFMIRPKTPFGTTPDAHGAQPEPNMIRLLYGEGESGWAEDLGDGTAKIANVPFGGDLNLHDIVKIVVKDGRKTAGEVISRAFPNRTAFKYAEPHEANYAKLHDACVAAGWHLEGAVPGFAVCAHPADTNFADLAKLAGVEVTCGD